MSGDFFWCRDEARDVARPFTVHDLRSLLTCKCGDNWPIGVTHQLDRIVDVAPQTGSVILIRTVAQGASLAGMTVRELNDVLFALPANHTLRLESARLPLRGVLLGQLGERSLTFLGTAVPPAGTIDWPLHYDEHSMPDEQAGSPARSGRQWDRWI